MRFPVRIIIIIDYLTFVSFFNRQNHIFLLKIVINKFPLKQNVKTKQNPKKITQNNRFY